MGSGVGQESRRNVRGVSLEGHLALHNNDGEWEVANLFTGELLELETGGACVGQPALAVIFPTHIRPPPQHAWV